MGKIGPGAVLSGRVQSTTEVPAMRSNCTCMTCGKLFWLKPSRAASTKYCGWTCRQAVPKPPGDLVCALCGTAFHAKPSKVSIGSGKFCSRACWGKSQSSIRVSRTCIGCGGLFLAQPNRVARGGANYCGKECLLTARFIAAEDRFWDKVNKNGPIPSYRPDLGSCWLWLASCRPNGYGQFAVTVTRIRGAHRFSYESMIGTIQDDLELDHLCRVRSCVRPTHLEPVTHLENVRRGLEARQ